MTVFRKSVGCAAGIAIAATAGLVSYRALQAEGPEPPAAISGVPHDFPDAAAGLVKRGEYLTRAADCEACHTTAGGAPFAGGRPFKLPFGTIYATNLTPDLETGIGGWSDAQFLRAVRNGVGTHGNLYPAMSYTSYTALSTADALAIKAYLSSLKPVHATAPAGTLSFPFNQRWGMKLWNLVFFHPRRYQPDPARNAQWNRGAYLATALGHCGECHTPRNIGFAMRSREYLAGMVVEGWKAYNTTSNATYGIGEWSDRQLTGYLTWGHAPGRSSAAGPMAEVVEHSLQYLTPSDTQALVVYLRGIDPVRGAGGDRVELKPAAVAASTNLLAEGDAAGGNMRGRQLFEGDCAGCHQFNGVGRQSDYASLAGSHAVNDTTGTSMLQVILDGSSLTVNGRRQVMPGFGAAYSNEDVAAVANYVLAHFGSKFGQIDAAAVAAARHAH